MMREVVLHGALEKFGRSFYFDVKTVQEAVHALTSQVRGLYKTIRSGEFRVLADHIELGESEISMDLGLVQKIHITPVPVGSKDGGVFKVILGVALLGVGFAIGASATIGGGLFAGLSGKTFLMLGAGFMLNGIGQMLSPTPTVSTNESADDKPSYIFTSPLNITEEGNCIPCAYGSPYCSTLVISSGFSVDDVS